jgi:hypothetical protein
LADLFEDFDRDIFAIEQLTELRFIKSGIVEYGEQDVGVVMMQDHGEFIASGCSRMLAGWICGGHLNSLLIMMRSALR